MTEDELEAVLADAIAREFVVRRTGATQLQEIAMQQIREARIAAVKADTERKRKRRSGWTAITLWVHRQWIAEALAQSGYGNPDDDSREAVQRRAQEHIDDMQRDAGGDVPRGTSGES